MLRRIQRKTKTGEEEIELIWESWSAITDFYFLIWSPFRFYSSAGRI